MLNLYAQKPTLMNLPIISGEKNIIYSWSRYSSPARASLR